MPHALSHRTRTAPGGLPPAALKLIYADDLSASRRPVFARAALPGTPQKLEVLAERYWPEGAAEPVCQDLHHPNDLTIADCHGMGMVLVEPAANGATTWADEGEAGRRGAAAATTAHAIADEEDLREQTGPRVFERLDTIDYPREKAKWDAWHADFLARLQATAACAAFTLVFVRWVEARGGA